MLRHKFWRSDGRLVKLLLSSTLVDKSPLTFIYFTIFEKKSQVSPTYTTKLFGFWKYIYINLLVNYHILNVLYILLRSIIIDFNYNYKIA